MARTPPDASTVGGVPACRLLGHDLTFRTDGPVMRWSCRRGCGYSGEKVYASEEDARRYAAAFDRRDADQLGRRAPLLGLLPLRLAYWVRRRRARAQGSP